MNEISTPPFATFIRVDEHYLLSASPERYLKRKGTKLSHNPSKELQRTFNDVDDQHIAYHLANDQKERSENIMIVDLVRNDLSKTAEKGSVQVEELSGIPIQQVHPLISTVSSRIASDTHPVDVIRNSFPMGSMTGLWLPR